ncbi:transporter [Acidobacteriota bacterium]
MEVPHSWGTTQGRLFEAQARRDFSGFNDLGITLSVNLFGAPSMTPKDFMEFRAKPHSLLGASIRVLAPTGRYEQGRLINVGTNRWSFKSELGYTMPLTKKWILELDLGAWFFTADNDFIMGKRKQNPILAVQAHLVRRFKAGFWAALDVNYFTGGQQTIGGGQLIDWQHSSRIGGTVVVPFLGRHAIKAGYSYGAYTKFGNDFNQFQLSYIVRLN